MMSSVSVPVCPYQVWRFPMFDLNYRTVQSIDFDFPSAIRVSCGSFDDISRYLSLYWSYEAVFDVILSYHRPVGILYSGPLVRVIAWSISSTRLSTIAETHLTWRTILNYLSIIEFLCIRVFQRVRALQLPSAIWPQDERCGWIWSAVSEELRGTVLAAVTTVKPRLAATARSALEIARTSSHRHRYAYTGRRQWSR